MNCREAKQLFDTYLDGDLSGPLVDELGAHRIECSHCRRSLDLLEVAGQVMATDADAPDVADDFTARVLLAAEELPPRRSIAFRRLVYVGGSLAAAACVLLVATLWMRGDSVAGASAEGSTGLDHGSPTSVAGFTETVSDIDELRGNVTEALRRDPENTRLQRLLNLINTEGQSVLEETRNRTKALEQYGKKTMMEVLESVQRDLAAETPGDDAADSTNDPQSDMSVDHHDDGSTPDS